MRQALALRRVGVELEVIAPCDWIPRVVARFTSDTRVSSRALCPPRSEWDGLQVHHPRWPRYHAGPHARLAFAHPGFEMAAAWAGARPRLRAIASRFGPHLIYAHGSVVNGEVGRRLAQELGLPLVCHDHDLDEIRSCRSLPARRRHLARVCLAAEAVLVPSRRLRTELDRVAPGACTVVVPNGADPDPIRAAPTSDLIVLCVGGFYPRKQVPSLVDAFAVVARRHPGVRLRVVGDGADRRAVEAAIARHGLERSVVLLGQLPHDRVQAEMRRAAVFALLSRDEPFGVVYLEALAAGVPVVCFDDAGVTDVIEDRVHGRIVARGDVEAAAAAIGELLGDMGARLRMGEAGRRLVAERLNWNRNAQAVSALFDSLV